MSKRAIEFVDTWVSENINAEGYPAEGEKGRAKQFAEHCLIDAEEKGIKKKEIEEETGNLVDHSRPHKVFELAPIKPFKNFPRAVEQVLHNCLLKTEKARGPVPTIREGDARSLQLADNSIDLVLTSPPYMNAIDYLRCSKFSLVWMGWSTRELSHIRRARHGRVSRTWARLHNVKGRRIIASETSE